jgi:predicted transcriptional regulator
VLLIVMVKMKTNVNFSSISGRAGSANGGRAKRDQILWILSENDGKMKRSKLRVRAGMRYALLNPILEELKKEGRIGMTGDLVSLNR